MVGRRETENGQLEYMHSLPEASSAAMLLPDNFRGAMALLIGPVNEQTLAYAGGLAWRYGKVDATPQPQVRVVRRDEEYCMKIAPHEMAQQAKTLAG